jgi:hypothetical protein
MIAAAAPKAASRRETIWTKVMSRVEVLVDGCWLWKGPDSGRGRGGGYPRMCLDGATMAVHIVMWIIVNGPIPPKKQLDHTCNRRLCVNPEHTEMVTHKINQKRRDARRRAVAA